MSNQSNKKVKTTMALSAVMVALAVGTFASSVSAGLPTDRVSSASLQVATATATSQTTMTGTALATISATSILPTTVVTGTSTVVSTGTGTAISTGTGTVMSTGTGTTVSTGTVVATGTRTATAMASGTALLTGTASPTGCVVTRLLLVPDSTNDRVMAFDATTGNMVNANYIPADPTHLSTPKNAILGPDGASILVVDQIDDVVQRYSLTGTYLGVFAPAGGPNTAILDNAIGITLRPNGNLLVTVTGGANQDSVAEFNTSGVYVGNFIANGSGGLDGPFDVYRRASTNDYLVSGINSDNILRYDANGMFLNVFTSVPASFLQQIAESVTSNVLVANFSGSPAGVLEYTAGGTFVVNYAPITGNRGVYELPNGNLLTTTGNGVFEISRSGVLVDTKISGVDGQYIELVTITSGGCTATPTASAVGTGTVVGTGTTTAQATMTRTAQATGSATQIVPTITITVIGTGTSVATGTRTGTAMVTGTSTQMATMTRTAQATGTGTMQATMTRTAVATGTGTAVATGTAMITGTMTRTAVASMTAVASTTRTATVMNTTTAVASMTGTAVASMTRTVVSTMTGTAAATMTPCTGRVTICHRTGNGNSHTITVSCNALPAHLAHGDTVGACPAATPRPRPNRFNDVSSSDYFQLFVLDLNDAGALGGYDDGSFRPYNPATRGQFVKIAVLAFEIPLYEGNAQSFSDVPVNSTFYRYIETARRDNIISGYSDGTFRPFANVTRGQIAKIAVESARMQDLATNTPSFTDVPVGHTFYRYVETAYANGILSGYSDGTFRPNADAVRGQVAKIIDLATHEGIDR